MSLKSIFSSLSWWTQFPLAYTTRDEVISGGIVTAGATPTVTELMCITTELECVLNGKIKAPIAALAAPNGDDLLDSTTPGVGRPIFSDGDDASVLSLGAGEISQVSLIVCNSKGDGTVDDDDNGAAVLVAVVAGTSGDYDGKGPLTSDEVTAALAAAAVVHDGNVSWQWVAQIEYDNDGGVTVAPTMNRNNVLGV